MIVSTKYMASIVSIASPCATGYGIAAQGGSTPGSAVWFAANEAVFVPFYLTNPVLVTRIFVLNGAAVSGNVDVGIYTQDGNLIVGGGGAAQAGTNQPQYFNIADTMLGAGRYYIACVLDNVTGRVFRDNINNNRARQLGILRATSAYPLPSSATFVELTSGGQSPVCGLEIAGGMI